MKKPSIRTEREWLKKYNIDPHPNSGRGKWLKGDGSDDVFVWDVKEAGRSFRFDEQTWIKICTDAYKTDPYKNPGLLIILGDRTEVVIIEAQVLQDIRQELKELKEALVELKSSDNP